MKLATAEALSRARAEARPVVLATRLPDGGQFLVPGDDVTPEVAAAADRALHRDESGTVKLADGSSWFFAVQNPQARLIVVGAVHIAQALVGLAVQLDFGVTVVDPRKSFASKERFPGVALSNDWPDEALDALRPDSLTAVVTLTHDPKLDDPALDLALRSTPFYVGALGSRKTHAARLERLRALGHDDATLARIRGPIGLRLAAVSAPEIALSILAEIVAVRRGGEAAG